MKALLIATSLIFGFAAAGAYAQAPADAPAGTTGLCKDGSYYSGASKKGACRGHKGVKDWYGDAASAAPTKATRAPKMTAPATSTAAAAAPAGATGLCKDGTYYSGDTKRGACRGHKGVKDWYGASAVAPAAPSSPMSPSAPKSDMAPASAAAPAAAPAGSTGLCKDGTYYSGATKRGACRGHKGVKDWYGASAVAPAAPSSPMSSSAPKSDMAPASAAAPAAAPAGSTGLCKDGTYYSGATKRGACRGHKGVKDWYGTAAAGAGAATAMPSKPAMPPAANPMEPANPAMPANPAAPSPKRPVPPMSRVPGTDATPPETRAAAPGGGMGKVWVNSESKVYHCQDDRYYGKTKQGEYMSEADALATGNRASRGKACTK
ncbi:MAG: DUF3761 domain-containing protein [Dokdonella sp.]